LLNGGFESHQKKDYHGKSRGIIVNELLAAALPIAEWNNTELAGIEPFTLIMWNEQELHQLVWDGKDKHTIMLDNSKPYIWSSATLYNPANAANRKNLFLHWINTKPIISRSSIFNFLQSFTDAENGFIMNRNEQVKTLSYTSIEVNKHKAIMEYNDFLSGIKILQSISFNRQFQEQI
jgi:hypothetical protein